MFFYNRTVIKNLPISIKLIYAINFLTGTVHVFWNYDGNSKNVLKKSRYIFVFCLCAITSFSSAIYIVFVSKMWNSYTSLKFILIIISFGTSIISTIICWIESLLFHNSQMKIISNSFKIYSYLYDGKSKSFRSMNLKISFVIFVLSLMFVIPLYFTTIKKKFALFQYWMYYQILTNDWVIVKYAGELLFNIENFKCLNEKLKLMCRSDKFSLIELQKVMFFYEKVQENTSMTKFVLFNPVNETI